MDGNPKPEFRGLKEGRIREAIAKVEINRKARKDHKEICWFYTSYLPVACLEEGFAIGLLNPNS